LAFFSPTLIIDYLTRYKGFRSNHVVQSPTPNEAGAKVKMAQVLFDSPDLAVVAKDAMDGFLLKKGWKMSVTYI
jgi:U2 small nuclear ribonucleoprotein B''